VPVTPGAHAILPVTPGAPALFYKLTNKFTIFKLRSTTEQMPALVVVI
jgi:hypothetical protein